MPLPTQHATNTRDEHTFEPAIPAFKPSLIYALDCMATWFAHLSTYSLHNLSLYKIIQFTWLHCPPLIFWINQLAIILRSCLILPHICTKRTNQFIAIIIIRRLYRFEDTYFSCHRETNFKKPPVYEAQFSSLGRDISQFYNPSLCWRDTKNEKSSSLLLRCKWTNISLTTTSVFR